MTFIAVAIPLLAAVASGGCGDEAGSDEPQVVATTGIVADITRNLAGEDLAVTQLIPSGSSPHDFQLSAKDRQGLEQADLVVAVGSDLEASVPLDDLGSTPWELAGHVPSPIESDPHVWMDPRRVAAALPDLAQALGEIDPSSASSIERRAREYAGELRRLDREVEEVTGRIPPSERKLVTSHDSLSYFADRYGFEVVATAFPSSGPEAEASAGQVDAVADAATRAGVPTVFAEEEDDPEVLRLVAEAADVSIEENLLIESLGSAGSYTRMLRHDAQLVADGLARR